jgi:pyruvate,orthophosphate dikinase
MTSTPDAIHFGGGARPAVPPLAVIGNKAHGLLRLVEAGLPVPAGFVLGTEWCRRFHANGERAPAELDPVLDAGIRELERVTGSRLGDRRRPLLVSVRSGAAVSMPGMMVTVLNVGLNDDALQGLIRSTGHPRFAWDTYRRFIQGYGETVCGLSGDPFEEVVAAEVRRAGVPSESELDVAALRAVCAAVRERSEACAGAGFPQDPREQLHRAVEAVFRSWQSDPARTFRRLHHLDDAACTAVTVQAMVFGNMGRTSGSGVAFTRDPATGEDRLYLDFLSDAQGEDVVSGRRTAQGADELLRRLPPVHTALERIRHQLESLFGEAQEFEFTVQEGRLFLLQTRNAKRTPWAGLRIAVEMAVAGTITRATALERLRHYDLKAITQRVLAVDDAASAVARGVPAGPGVVAGRIVLDSEAAVRLTGAGDPVILVRRDTSTADLAGMAVADGILTTVGSRTSHAAVVARDLNKVCVVGCTAVGIEPTLRRVRVGDRWFEEGDFLTLDGSDGRIYAGRIEVVDRRPLALLAMVDAWRAEAASEATSAPVSAPSGGSGPMAAPS